MLTKIIVYNFLVFSNCFHYRLFAYLILILFRLYELSFKYNVLYDVS